MHSQSNLERECTKIELFFLSMAMLCLPIFEAPKNFASVFFILIWFYISFKKRNFGKGAVFEWIVFGLAIILLVAPIFSDFSSPADATRWGIIALVTSLAARLIYTSKQLAFILYALMAGNILAVAESFWMWIGTSNTYPEFRSVGHVNHSIMYSNVAFGIGIATWLSNLRWAKTLGAVTLIACLVYWVASVSSGGAVTMIGISVTAFAIWAYYKSSVKAVLIPAIVLLIGFSGLVSSPLTNKLRTEISIRYENGDFFAGRDKILASALIVWQEHPVFGTGWHSFLEATSEERVRSQLESNGEQYNPREYYHTSHGHNLWTTILIERGLLGIILINILLYSYLRVFASYVVRTKNYNSLEQMIAVSCSLTLAGFMIGGLTNTTMMNEHGYAGMMVLAVGHSYLRKNLKNNITRSFSN